MSDSGYQVLNNLKKETVTAITNSTARSLTAANLLGTALEKAKAAVIIVEDEAIRYWTTGDDPTASVGMLAQAGSSITLQGYHDISNFKCISTSASNAKITAQIYFPF